jgi:hypothetical protein
MVEQGKTQEDVENEFKRYSGLSRKYILRSQDFEFLIAQTLGEFSAQLAYQS